MTVEQAMERLRVLAETFAAALGVDPAHGLQVALFAAGILVVALVVALGFGVRAGVRARRRRRRGLPLPPVKPSPVAPPRTGPAALPREAAETLAPPGAEATAPPAPALEEVEPAPSLPELAAPASVEPAAPAPAEPPAPLPAEVPAPVEEPPPPPKRRPLRERLARTQEALVGRLGALLGGRELDKDLLEELEALLFTADLGVGTAESLLERVRRDAAGGDEAKVRAVLRDAIAEKLRAVQAEPRGLRAEAKPHVILVLGVNGSGKTTTIGKLAARYRQEGYSVVLGAADTFRAAAREQLEAWGERAGCQVVSGPEGGDPAAVAFDAIKAARSQALDVAIVDTAGRLQTKAPLMEELGKIVRVIGRDLEGAPHETLLVLDANTGQNAISQAREFTAAAGVSGLVLTKLDGTAKGGVIVGLADEFGIPVRFVGVGEGVEDLRDFDAEEFVEALFAGS